MDESTRLRMRRAHANHCHDCPCGRRVFGNGWRSHARSCPTWLRDAGYPLAESEENGLRENGFTLEERKAIRLELGRLRLAQIPAPGWSWPEFVEHLRTAVAAAVPNA